MARSSAKAQSKTVYCSFCGKSQFDVELVVAGPSVFICNECTDLCVDIVREREDYVDTDGKDGFYKLRFSISWADPLSDLEISAIPEMLKSVEAAFPGCSIKYRKLTKGGEAEHLSVDVTSPPSYNPSELRDQIKALTVKLRIAQQQYLSEKENREKLERELSDIMKKLFPILMDKLAQSGDLPDRFSRSMSVLFLDISGFSQMDDISRVRNVEMLRSFGRVILKSESGMYLNTWGDAIVAAFDEPDRALRCGCKFVQHFGLLGMDARVGIAWGSVRVAMNEIKRSYDIDGAAVNLGARLESAADIGTVVCVPEIVELLGDAQNQFHLREKKLSLRKAVGEFKAGDQIEVFEVQLRPNA